MTIPGISRTCIYVAAGRAIGAREPDAAVRNPDDLAERLLGDPKTWDVDHPAVQALALPYDEAMSRIEVVNIVRMMTIRTRFIDAALEKAIADGATQLVILGAGLDSHAYRFRRLLENVRVFEVDRPATQAMKRERARQVLGEAPSNLTYVPIDFQHEDLAEVLARHGYDRTRRTFFIMEGVTMYVEEAGVRQTLQFIGSHPPRSGLVFDFVPRAMIEMIARIDMNNVPEISRPYLQRFLDLIKDEPWVFGIPLGTESEFLGEFGLTVREVLTIGGPESVARYLTRADGTQVGGKALQELMARMAAQAKANDSGTAGSQAPQMTPERMREQQRQMAYQLAEAVVAADEVLRSPLPSTPDEPTSAPRRLSPGRRLAEVGYQLPVAQGGPSGPPGGRTRRRPIVRSHPAYRAGHIRRSGTASRLMPGCGTNTVPSA